MFSKVADNAMTLRFGLIILALVIAHSIVGPLENSPIIWNSSMMIVSTSLRVSHEKRVRASNDSKTITDKSADPGCFPTEMPCSSNFLNSFTFSFWIEMRGAA